MNSNSASSYINELGESDLHLEDYPALSSHSWSALHTFNQFEHKRELIAKLQPDKKGRKVVNLCLVQGTLHNVARVMKTKREAEEKVKAAKKASKGKGKAKEETEEEDAYKTPVLNTSSTSDTTAENNIAAEDPKDVDISAEIAQSGATQIEEKKKEQEDAPQDIAQEVADPVARFTNLVVPTTKPGQSQSQSRPRNGSHDEQTTDTLRTSQPRNGPGYVTAYDHFGGSQYRPNAEGGESASFLPPLPPSHPPCTVSVKAHNGSFKDHKANNGNPFGNGMDFIKRAADFIAPPPPSSAFARPLNSRPAAPVDLVASLAAAASTAARNASRYAETASTSANIASAGLNRVRSAQDAAKAARDAAYAAREQAMLDAAIAASEREAEDKAMEEVQERLLKAITTNDNKSNKSKNTTSSASPTARPTLPTSSDKLASLKQSFDKFVNDFNANLADAFGGLPPGYEMPSETITTTTSSAAEPAGKTEEEKVRNQSGQQEKKATAEHGLNKFAHNATCDICDEWIVGTRYKCFSCPDW